MKTWTTLEKDDVLDPLQYEKGLISRLRREIDAINRDNRTLDEVIKEIREEVKEYESDEELDNARNFRHF